MGARNVMLAYQLYAGTIPPQSMQLLVYMCLVSKDDDERPWYGQGHVALAENALGRPAPATKSDLRAVERSVSSLLAASAITVGRPAAPRRHGPSTVRYDLNLHLASAPNARQKVSGERPTVFDPTPDGKCRETPDENRRTEETRGGDKRSEAEEKDLSLQEPSHAGAREESNNEDHHEALAHARAVLKPLTDVDTLMHRAREDLADDADFAAIIIRAAELAKDAA